MTVFWKCKTTTWSQYYKQIDYLSDPSVDLIEQFKKDIVNYDDPKSHSDYVPCSHVEKSKGHMLFILGSRVEIMVYPNFDTRILYFINCEDNQ